jgi:sulfur carrier protein ThiS|tara:strand:- start:546 stop:752 length:207 start_codon:yes stop_codon:yes gene_type:complete
MKLRIMNDTGHTVLDDVTVSDVIDQINDHPTHWVFVEGEMVSRQEIPNISWDEVDTVNLIPAMVGGSL